MGQQPRGCGASGLDAAARKGGAVKRYYLMLAGHEFGPYASFEEMLDGLLDLVRMREAAESPSPRGASWRVEEVADATEAGDECSE